MNNPNLPGQKESDNAGWLRRLVRRLVMDTLPDMDESIVVLLATPVCLRSPLVQLLILSFQLSNLALKFCFELELLILRLQKQKLLMERRYLLVKVGLVGFVSVVWAWCYGHNFMCVKKSNAVKPPNEKS
jgi:hypothetical protein